MCIPSDFKDCQILLEAANAAGYRPVQLREFHDFFLSISKETSQIHNFLTVDIFYEENLYEEE